MALRRPGMLTGNQLLQVRLQAQGERLMCG